MIFVTVGFDHRGFERLVKRMDYIAGQIDEEVIMQIGHTQYCPKNASFFKFIDDDDMFTHYKNARLSVIPAGAGTILNLLNLKRPFILVPKLKIFKEIIDDQQLELATFLANKWHILCITNIKDLDHLLAKKSNIEPVIVNPGSLIQSLQRIITKENVL